MLDFENLTQVDRDTLLQAAWARKIGNSPSLSSSISGDSSWSYFYDIKPEFYTQSDHFKKLLGEKNELHEALEKLNPGHCLQELGLPPEKMPTLDEINKNYRKLALKHHPDRNLGDASAKERFIRVQASFEKVIDLHKGVEQEAVAQEEKIKKHFAAHSKSKGWKKDFSSSGRPIISFPVDHLTTEQKDTFINSLRAEGYSVEERFSSNIGGKAISIADAAHESLDGAEVMHKLQRRFKGGVMPDATKLHQTEEAADKIAATESKAENALENIIKSEEETTTKAGGKAKWIIGGIVAATVAVGAFITYKRKTAADYKKERQQEGAAAHSIG